MRAPYALAVACLSAVLLMQPTVCAQSKSDDPSSSPAIIFVAIGAAVVLVMLGGACVWRRRARKSKHTGDIELGGANNNSNNRQLPDVHVVNDIGRNGHGANVATAHSNGNYDRHNSPAVANKHHRTHEQPPPSHPPRPQRPAPQARVASGNHSDLNVPTLGTTLSGNSSSYVVSQSSSTGTNSSSTRDDSTRSREVLTLVLADLQRDPAVGQRKIAYSALYFTRVLSKGAFGEVWLAQLENRQVAVKRILSEKRNDEKEIVCFGAEIKLMASFQHPKIVAFVGVSWSSTHDICAVTEYMAKGDLFYFLKRRSGQLTWPEHKIYLAEDVADALVYLHSLTPKVIHRDLKSKNILLDETFRAKLSDFGISRERSLEETMTAGVGTIYWTAPEVLLGKKYTEKADIYSFGIVLSELDTHKVPYHDVTQNDGRKLQAMKIVQKVLREHIRPTFSAVIPSIVLQLAQRCLNADPDVRPDASELLRLIQAIQQQL